ncbi:unnamed protein product [Phytomonas sp. EM1]|nr:unnamed protein product [Phytomonas sp. EM1]|eukprot:CCW61701.1 unnamed protein product [Phytomonas sp. isolate EM1]
MRLASDHRPTREQVLEEAQKRRQARMETQRHNQCALKIQRRVRVWQACQSAIRLAVDNILSIETNGTIAIDSKRCLSSEGSLSECTGTSSLQVESVQRLERACWCFHYIQQHRTIIPITLLEFLMRTVDLTGEKRVPDVGGDGEAFLPLTSRFNVMRAQRLVEKRCSAVVSDVIRNLSLQGIGTCFSAIQYVPVRLLSHMISILIDGIPNGVEEADAKRSGWAKGGPLATLRELAMVVAAGGSAEAMECVLSVSLLSCAVSLAEYPDARRTVLELLMASLKLRDQRPVRVLALSSTAWMDACWACLTENNMEEYPSLTDNPLAVLLSTEVETVQDEEDRNPGELIVGSPMMCGELVRGIVFAAFARLQTFLVSGVFPNFGHQFSMAREVSTNAKNIWQVVGMRILGRLTRLLPYFLKSNEIRVSGQINSWPSTPWYMPTQKIWLWCIGILCEKLCQTDLFVQTILFDLHHSRASGTGGMAPSLSGGGGVEVHRVAQARYRSLVSYLFSPTGGLCLLEQLAVSSEEPNRGSLPPEIQLPSMLDNSREQIFDMSALEIACSVYAWPLYTFSLASPGRRLETAAVFARLVRFPSLIRQLWQLYKRHCEGLSYVLQNAGLLQKLCMDIAAPNKNVRLPFWPNPPQSLLVGTPCKVPLLAFWDPTPTISVFFFTLFCYYIDVTNFVEELSSEVVLSRHECWVLVLALKEIVFRSHFHGVVPSTNSEAVAHLAYNLLSKLHIVDEATTFVPCSSLWVCMTTGELMRILRRMPAEMWEDITARHATLQRALEQKVDNYLLTQPFGDDADSEDIMDENEISLITTKGRIANILANCHHRLPGDDLLFLKSCEWGMEERFVYLLFHAPFLFSFPERAELLTVLLLSQQLDRFPIMGSNFVVRRGCVFADAFDRFRSCPDSPEMYMVRFARDNNELEEGYGRGVYREFMVSLCIEGFSVEHGLFRQTDSGMVYPNPFSHEATGDSAHLQKISFLGAMVGRSLCDGILQDVPFALHFRNSLLGRRNSINNLKSFDNQLYRQLRSLAELGPEDMEAMGLTFVYTVNALGITREVELISGGADISVTASNCLHYMHLVADFKLNREGSEQTRAFQAGLEAIVKPVWLQLFDSNELLKLFSGDESGKIDIEDWKAHTVYQKPEDAESVPVRIFWEVVESLTTEQQRLLLKFATSMNRSPLLGFRFLSPPFNLQLLQESMKDRLPSASTCFSTLKLPPYTNFATARQKIIAALEGTTTFELS